MRNLLKEIDDLWADIEATEAELQEFWERAVRASARPTDEERVPCVADRTKLNVVEQYIQAETEQLEERQHQLRGLIDELRGYLDKLDNSTERSVLSQRYVMRRNADDIAAALGYSSRYVYKLLRSGKRNIYLMMRET